MVRFAPRELPGGDAAAFVAESIRSMPPSVLDVGGPVDAIRALVPLADADIEELAPDRPRVRIGSGSDQSLLSVVTILATAFAVEVREPAALGGRVDVVAAHLSRGG